MAGKFNVTVKITEGILVRGSEVKGTSHGITDDGLESFDATWSGTYEGMKILDDTEDIFHTFRDGEVNGTPQKMFGMPMYQFTI